MAGALTPWPEQAIRLDQGPLPTSTAKAVATDHRQESRARAVKNLGVCEEHRNGQMNKADLTTIGARPAVASRQRGDSNTGRKRLVLVVTDSESIHTSSCPLVFTSPTSTKV